MKKIPILIIALLLFVYMLISCSNFDDKSSEVPVTPHAQNEDFIDGPIGNQLEMTRNCIATTLNEFEVEAQLIFKNVNTQGYMNFFLPSGPLYDLSDTQWTQYYISPNHDEYIYYQKDVGWFYVPKPAKPTSDYLVTEQLPDFDHTFLISNWFYEDHLLLEHYVNDPIQELNLLNLRTKEYEKILLDLPDPLFFENKYYGENEFDKYRFSVETNKQLTRAIFYSSDKTKKIYWDIEKEKILAEFPINSDDLNDPPGQFSPDGEDYYILLNVMTDAYTNDAKKIQELFHVDRDGNINRLTNFGDYYSSVEISMEPIFHDNLYIPLWVDLKGKKYFVESETEEEIPKLIFLNTRTGELRGICFVEDYRFGERRVVDWIVYGDYFLIPLYPPGESQHPVWHIINLIRNEVYSLNFPYSPDLLYVGWLSYEW